MTDDHLDAVTYHAADGIATIRLNQPATRNRLDHALVAGLEAAWRRFSASDERVAVLAAGWFAVAFSEMASYCPASKSSDLN